MNTELSIFRVIAGKESRADEWMRVLASRRADCVATLDREAMHLESVFKHHHEGRMYLAWFSVQGAHHASVESSGHEIDKLHVSFWRECIDATWSAFDMEHVVTFAPSLVDETLLERDEQLRAGRQK